MNRGQYIKLNFLGISLMEVEYFKEAIAMFDEAIKLNPSDATAYFNKGG